MAPTEPAKRSGVVFCGISRRRVECLAVFVFALPLIIITSNLRSDFFAKGPAAARLEDDARPTTLGAEGGKTAAFGDYPSSSMASTIWLPNDMISELLLEEQRQIVAEEMADYIFPTGKYNTSASTLKDLIPEEGGEPLRSVVITTWRSGSTFLGDILNNQPGNFYHYEPLLPQGVFQVGDESPLANSSLSSLRELLHCNYTNMEAYLTYDRYYYWHLSHNSRLWKACKSHGLCWDPSFLAHFCKLFPFQSMKVVRLKLNLASRLLEDDSLNMRIVFLVRDPRGTLQSRRLQDWCLPYPDCSDTQRHCSNLVDDYRAAVELVKVYPHKFRVVRYEDLSLNPFEVTTDLFEFLGLAQGVGDKPGGTAEGSKEPRLYSSIVNFLETHTKADEDGTSSPHKNSKLNAFRWRETLKVGEIATIQSSCKEAMLLWGYKELIIERNSSLDMGDSFMGQSDLDNFNPLMKLVLK
ncbi:carbohydrate sulfotransferase 5-like [Hetaerina americana]|uniref:carbohydrate sulfotransferase 5-like n=1 Tax=Hetaerina americana TaxID=62018 RepID=UPI003A7F3EA4